MHGKASSPAEMEALGCAAAERIILGDVFGLIGGLGSGKTHWTRGFVAALGAEAQATSPTFPLIHEYSAKELTVFHFDFYRLESAEELLALGWDEYLEAGGVIVAEWADKFPDLMPPATIWLRFSINADGGRTVELLEEFSG